MQRELSSKEIRVISEVLLQLQVVHSALDRDLDEARKFQGIPCAGSAATTKAKGNDFLCCDQVPSRGLGTLVGYFAAGRSWGIWLECILARCQLASMAARLAGTLLLLSPPDHTLL